MADHETPELAFQATESYDPRYDPLVADHPGFGSDYSPTYWVASAGEPPPDDGAVRQDMEVDVAIVGSGFTGLATALFLAREHGIRATVLEANRSVWGCTSRNGGQGQNATGRLYRSQWITRWGKATALKLDAEVRSGFDTFHALVREFDCDAQHGGHLYVAHKPSRLKFLEDEAKVMRDVFGYKVRILGTQEFRRDFVNDHEAHGAMHEAEGIGVHPLKLAHGYMRAARTLGARVHPGSPVTAIETRGSFHLLKTPNGVVKARAVAFATGGYTSNELHPSLASRIMPVLSNSLVTRPLTEEELKRANFRTNVFLTDTRTLRFYYRLLPDKRIQIGSRSAITGADAPDPRHLDVLLKGLHRKFPALRQVGIDHSWWGWVDVSHDMMPRVFQPNPKKSVYYALGYGGNGVSFSAHAGRRMAELIAGRASASVLALPIYDSPLPYPRLLNRFESRAFAPFRRIGQRFLYHVYQSRDERD